MFNGQQMVLQMLTNLTVNRKPQTSPDFELYFQFNAYLNEKQRKQDMS